MDILDIDEVLKDDSYIYLADKTHDDICNILKQWKLNNQQQTQPSAQMHYNNEQAYKHNSKTFTRPKRKSLATQQLDITFSQSPLNVTKMMTAKPVLNVEIGGLVTNNMHNSLLQDTSPPSSISSSMTNDQRMDNSLITSADFTNLNFLQSTQNLETDINLATKLNTTVCNNSSYTLCDIIRDRKALESLTMSSDGTLIKDSHITQIDDISLTLSKTTSGCSTMNNSTDESLSTPNENRVAAQQTMILNGDMICDTTFNFVDSLTTTPILQIPVNVKKGPVSENLLLPLSNSRSGEANITPEMRSETPENLGQLASLHFESTPLNPHGRELNFYNNNNNHTKQQPLDRIANNGDVDISPIVANTRQQLNNTFEMMPPFDGSRFITETMELLEQIEQPLNNTYNKAETTEQAALLAQHKNMQCVMDLAEAEVELLAQQGDEEQFEHILAKLGKVNGPVNAEKLKMQKSLECIKRRFNTSSPAVVADDMASNVSTEIKDDDPLKSTKESSSPLMLSSNGSSCTSGERLLSRRSRLYDDVNLNSLHGSHSNTSSCNSTSYIVQRKEDNQSDKNTDQAIDDVSTLLEKEKTLSAQSSVEECSEMANYKLTERRKRDRERFKTIKITKDMRPDQQAIIVPCIDDDPIDDVSNQLKQEEEQEHQSTSGTAQRLSRRERSNQIIAAGSQSNTKNYLTYKKPKERSSLAMRHQLPEVEQQPRSLSRPRFISGLQKLTAVSKATSACAGLNENTQTTTLNERESEITGTPNGGKLKSPMGIKSKSFHNLSSHITTCNSTNTTAQHASTSSCLRRPGQPSKLTSGLRAPATHERQDSELKGDGGIFKVPRSLSGLRAPSAKRVVSNGLARPSSGYYSLSVATNSAVDANTPESLSSASSRGSLYGTKDNNKQIKGGNNSNTTKIDTQILNSKLTQITTNASGIPKPSGLRPPSQIKRSALPRPSSIVRR